MSEVFGAVYAPAYDALYGDKDYDGETRLLCQIFQRYATTPVRTVLDMGCGTGRHALCLAARGFEVVGVDRSAEMLSVARRKADVKAGSVRFYRADIRGVELSRTFDAVVMMFAVLGYQLENEDVQRVLGVARRHLRAGGLVAFDVWYGPAVLAQGTEVRMRRVKDGDELWVRTSSGKVDPSCNHCHVEFHLKHARGDDMIEEARECHTVRYYFPQEIEALLNVCGFRLLRLGAFPEFDRDPDSSTWNVMAVAEAV